MVGCDVRHTDIYAREISGALEHLQEGTRESRPMMGTGHQQKHRTDGWCDVHASQCSYSIGAGVLRSPPRCLLLDSAVGVRCDVTSQKRWAMVQGSFAAKIALKIKEERRKVLPTNQS